MSVCTFGPDQGRVLMALQEGEGGLPEEVGEELRVWVAGKKLVQEGQGGHLGIFQDAEPETLMLLPEPEPAIEDTGSDAEAFTESFHREAGLSAGEVFPQRLEDKEEAIRAIRDDEIGEDGMRTAAAATLDTEDVQGFFTDLSVMVIHDVAVIVRMGMAVAG